MENDAIEEYKSSLSDLNCNSKPHINVLTIIAEENIKFAPQIVQVIEDHINTLNEKSKVFRKQKREVKKLAGADLKLPVLYLIDSIMKNVGRDYLNLFGERIVSIFSSVFEKVDEKTRVLLYKLRQTWTDIIPNKKLYAIDISVKQMDPAWPVTAQPPGQSIHINPKFLTPPSEKPEDYASVAIKETASELEVQKEVVKQLLAKQRIRRMNEEAKEIEKKNTTVRPTVLHVQAAAPVAADRIAVHKIDPRIAHRDPRLQKSSVVPALLKGPAEDKSVLKNTSSPSKTQQGPQQKHPSVPPVVPVHNTGSLQPQEGDVSSKTDWKSENSSDAAKKKIEKSVEAKNLPQEQTKTSEPKSNAGKRFPSPQKLSNEPDTQDKVQRAQDRKTRLDASPNKSKGSALKEKQGNTDSKQSNSSKLSTTEKSKPDIKDSHVEAVKHTGKQSKGSSKTSSETEKEPETHLSRSRTKAASEERKVSPRHRSRSPLHDEVKKKDSRFSKTSRSARHLALEKPDGEKSDSNQEPVVIPPDDLPREDTDLRVSARSSDSPEKSLKPSKRDVSSFKENEDQENTHEPPTKKVKEEKENKSADYSLFGRGDQDYRCKERRNKVNNHQGWAQYKAVHPDEFKSPLRPARENMENVGPGNDDFRDHEKLHSKLPVPEQHPYLSPEGECDRLGRPRLWYRKRNDMRFRGRRGRRYEQLPHHEIFSYDHNEKGYDVSMLDNPERILRQAEEKFHAGIISETWFREIRDGIQRMMDSARRLGLRMPTFNYSQMYPKYYDEDGFHGPRTRHMNNSRELGQQQPSHVKGPKRVPPSTCSFELDGVKRDIHFVDGKAIVVIDGVPKQIVLRGQPTPVFIEGMNPILVKFDGKPVEFDVHGKLHALRFGVPTRELYLDDYPYEGKFGGLPFFVDIDDKEHQVYLGKPIPEVVFLEEPQHELYSKFLAGICAAESSKARMSPISEQNVKQEPSAGSDSSKIGDTDFRNTENERTAVAGVDGSNSMPFDVDMRTVMIKKEPLESESKIEYSETPNNHPMTDMKDVDWRHHPSQMNYAPSARDNSCYPPSGADFVTVNDPCRPSDVPPNSMLHPGPPQNKVIKSEVDPNYRNAFTDSKTPMHQNLWNGPIPHESLEERGRIKSERQEWENSQERVMPWQEGGPRHPSLMVQSHDRPLPRIPSMPNWRGGGGRFTPPYSQSNPTDCALPPQRPKWQQPLENVCEGNPNAPGWDWKQRGGAFRPDVPPVHGHPPEQEHQYNMQQSESKPPFEKYRNPYEQLPPPPMPPRGPPLRMIGNQIRPDGLPVQIVRPVLLGTEMRNSRPPGPHQRQWLPRNPMEGMPPPIRECPPVLMFPHTAISGPPVNPPMRTTLPPPPLPPNMPSIPVSLQGPASFNLPRVPSPAVSEKSGVEPTTSQSYISPFSDSEVQAKTESVDTNSSQESAQAANEGPQQLTSQSVSQTTQDISMNALSQNTDSAVGSEVAPSSSSAAPNFMDLSTLVERLVAAGIISSKPAPAEKMEVTEPDGKNESEFADKEEPPPPPIEFTPECLKVRYPSVVNALFRGTQCASCGMRFKDTHGERYSRHLDWHFRVNRREKDGAKKAFSRKWYYDVDDWTQFEEFEDIEERARSFFEMQADEELLQAPASVEVFTVPAAHGNETEVCVVCGEVFQLLWLEEEEEWHLKDAVREDGQPYHPLCFEDFKKASEVPDTPVDDKPTPKLDPDSVKEEAGADKDMIDSTEDTVPKDDVKVEESSSAEETKPEDDTTVKQENVEESAQVVEESISVKEEPVDEPLEGKPGEEEIIGVITEFDTEEESEEPQKESKMVVLQSGGIVMKVRAESIQQPASPAPATPDKEQKKEEESEDDFRPPTPDPRFKVLPPVKKGTELSGLCSIM